MDPNQKFQTLLRQLFQFDCADLDFGIYRIMNHKRDVLEKWISETLPARVEAELRTGALRADSTTADRLEELKTQLIANFGADALDGDGHLAPAFHGTPLGKQYQELNQAARHAIAGGDQRAIIFNHLYQFFSHYYDSGDFMSLRRYSSRQKYAIPYNGEEVHLHWANADQYYIKTSEYFTDYRWKAPAPMGKGEFSVLFKLRNAEQESGNNKANAKRYFCFPTDELEFDEASRTLVLPVAYRALTSQEGKEFTGNGDKPQQMLNERALSGVLAHALLRAQPDLKAAITAPARNASGQEMTDPQTKEPIPLLLKHLRTYARRNNSDFFIHKDLDAFLTRELDFYLKNEVLSLDTLLAGGPRPAEGWFQLLHVIKTLGKDIITFLAQLENFQKTLFEKRKFVTDCHWCFTLDRVAADLLPEIAANPAQWAQWEDLHTLSAIEPKTKSWAKGKDPDKAIAWLKTMPYLMVDTSLFKDSDFQDRLLATIPNIDEQMDGLLVHSENFQAIRFLSSSYSQRVDAFYLDPPYNTPFSEIPYKNDFKHSCWISMMQQSLAASVALNSKTCNYVVAIDENESRNLSYLLSQTFADKKLVPVSVIHNPGGIQGKNLSPSNDFALFVYDDNEKCIGPEIREDADTEPLRDWGDGVSERETAKNCFFPILCQGLEIVGFGAVPDDSFHPASANVVREDGIVEVWPIDGNGIERKWRFARNSIRKIEEELFAARTKGVINIKRSKTFFRFKTVWFDAKYNANTYGSKLLGDIIPGNPFKFPKSISTVYDSVKAITYYSKPERPIVIDFFGGSGTTAHAIVEMAREGDRVLQYVLVEMGDYFDAVLTKRIKKIVFSRKWKKGEPVPLDDDGLFAENKFEGVSHTFKVIRLESYDDTLANIDFTHEAEGELFTRQVGEEYLLRYALDFETQGSATRLKPEALTSPFDYRLNLFDGTEIRSKPVDLPETFHYLIGLKVESRRWIERKIGKSKAHRYLHVTGTANGDGKRVAVVWRTVPDNWKEADYQAEKEWAEQTGLFKDADRGWYNGPGTFLGAHPLDAEFRRLLFA